MKRILVNLLRATVIPLIKMVYHFRIIGTENFPSHGGVLLIPNHVTWIDAILVSSACKRPVRFVMHDSFMKSPVIAWFARLFDTVPISATKAKDAVRVVGEALAEGSVVCLFAEGALTRTGCLQEIKRGFELMARNADVPVVTLWMDGLWGSIFSFERGKYFKKIPYAIPYGVTAVFGDPLLGKDANTANLRNSMMKSSALALADRAASLGLTQCTEINAFQIGQVNAIPRNAEIVLLENETIPRDVWDSFAKIFGAKIFTKEQGLHSGMIYIGSAITEQFLTNNPALAEDAILYRMDGQTDHQSSFLQLPCCMQEDVVISMSMPHPATGAATNQPQDGYKQGSLGRLLPGYTLQDGKLHSCVLKMKNIEFPYSLDAEGFVLLP